MTLKESKDMIQKVLKAYETLKEHSNKEYPIKMETLPEFFDACALAMEALDDIEEMATAVYRYEETCGFTKRENIEANYADAYRIAEKWYSKEHVTRKSIIKVQLEEIMDHFTDPVTYDELIKVIQEMKGDDT